MPAKRLPGYRREHDPTFCTVRPSIFQMAWVAHGYPAVSVLRAGVADRLLPPLQCHRRLLPLPKYPEADPESPSNCVD